jgi:hypothetical protein
MSRIASAAVVLATTMFLATCNDDSSDQSKTTFPTSPPVAEITIVDFGYRNLLQLVGGPSPGISIVNEGSVEHTFTLDELEIDEVLQPGDEVRIDLAEETPPAQYEYRCRFHPDMRGVIEYAG